jgi:long-chain acyl-CoA synthetase
MVEPVKGEKGIQDEFRFFGIYAKNRAEWVISDIASALYGLTPIPLYDTLGVEAMTHVFAQTGVTTVLCSGENISKLLQGVADKKYNTLKFIVSFDPLTDDLVKSAGEKGVNIYEWTKFLESGDKQVDLPKNLSKDTVFTFNYTSGTTALPKAAILTHGNVLAAVGGYNDLQYPALTQCGEDDSYLSYLPMAHVLERLFVHQMMLKGCSIGFYSGDPARLKDDFVALRPSIVTAVPRVLSRFADIIKSKLDALTGWKKDLAEKAIATKLENMRNGEGYTHFAYDKLVFGTMKEALGGRVKFIFCGGAPLAPEIGDFLKVCFCCPIGEGYGLTESSACGTIQLAEDFHSGRVGGPIPCVELKFLDVPEMNYLSTDKNDKGEATPRGEICLRGPNIFKGYYKNKKDTEEMLDDKGWLHTGDVGRLNPDGSLSIVDRKKNIFKIAQGEYIAPDKIENIYLQSKYVTECFVYGDSLKANLVGIYVPNEKRLKHLAEELKIEGTYEELCKNEKIKAAVLEDLGKAAKSGGLHTFEQVKKIHLEPVSFVLLNLCTPSLKLKRNPARDYYRKTIDELYL